MSRLKVVPIKEPKGSDHPDPISPVLPTHEFSMLIIAPRGSGKTTLILNFLSEFYKGYFHSIKVFSPTMNGDAKWETIKRMKGILAKNKHLEELEGPHTGGAGGNSDDDDDEEQEPNALHRYSYETSWHGLFASMHSKPPAIGDTSQVQRAAKRQKASDKKFTGKIPSKDFYSEYDEDTLQEIMNTSMAQIMRFKKLGKTKHHADRQLLIFDDCVGSNLFANKKVNPFRRLNTTLRHYSTSVIMVSQGYKEIPKTVRINASVVILYEIANQAELESIYEENTVGLTREKWMKVYQYCTSEPFNFMYINYKLPKTERVMRNFDEPIPLSLEVADTRETMQKHAVDESEED